MPPFHWRPDSCDIFQLKNVKWPCERTWSLGHFPAPNCSSFFSMSNETKRFSFNIWNEHQKHLTSQFEVIFVPLRFDLEEQFPQPHPEKLTWNITMEVWKVIFLSKWLIGRFQPLIFQGVLSLECLRKTLRPFELLPCPADQVGVVEEIIAGSRCRPFKCPTFFSKANKPQ